METLANEVEEGGGRADVTLDPNTANPFLILADDGRDVRRGDTWAALPDNPERFDTEPCPGPSRSLWTWWAGRWRLLMLKTKPRSLLSAWLHVLRRGYTRGSGWGWTHASGCVPDVEDDKKKDECRGLGSRCQELGASCVLAVFFLTQSLWPVNGRNGRSWRWTPPTKLLCPARSHRGDCRDNGGTGI